MEGGIGKEAHLDDNVALVDDLPQMVHERLRTRVLEHDARVEGHVVLCRARARSLLVGIGVVRRLGRRDAGKSSSLGLRL
jgi:hypothetical protein